MVVDLPQQPSMSLKVLLVLMAGSRAPRTA
jgi:hypothetical protein